MFHWRVRKNGQNYSVLFFLGLTTNFFIIFKDRFSPLNLFQFLWLFLFTLFTVSLQPSDRQMCQLGTTHWTQDFLLTQIDYSTQQWVVSTQKQVLFQDFICSGGSPCSGAGSCSQCWWSKCVQVGRSSAGEVTAAVCFRSASTASTRGLARCPRPREYQQNQEGQMFENGVKYINRISKVYPFSLVLCFRNRIPTMVGQWNAKLLCLWDFSRELKDKCLIGDKMPNWAFCIRDWGLGIKKIG